MKWPAWPNRGMGEVKWILQNGRNERSVRNVKATKNELELEPEECSIHAKEGKPTLVWSSGAALGWKSFVLTFNI